MTLGDEATGVEFEKHVVRTFYNTSMAARALVTHIAKNKPFKKFYLLNQDYSFGRDSGAAFTREIKKQIPGFRLQLPAAIEMNVLFDRTISIRDSVEDYEYMAILERLGLAAEAEKIVIPLAGSWFAWEKDPSVYETARARLAERIIAAKK